MKDQQQKPISEPSERFAYRTACKHFGFTGSCYKKSGWMSPTTHITMGCDGVCRRMKVWDNRNGYKGATFKIRELR